MARSVRVGDYQAMQRTSSKRGPTHTAMGEMAEDDEPPPSMGAQIRALLVGRHCSEEMSLGMVTDRVRDAAADASLDPSDAEIVEEAERIWGSFDASRKGPRVYEVEPDGTVRDWRRPDTTPDRGDVTHEHQVTDDAPRFSGGGADDAQQQSMFLVPNDADFRGRLYRDAPELANLAEKLITSHGFLEELGNCDIRWYWKRKTGVSKGRVKIGFMKRASDLLGHFSGADFIGWLSATTARDGKFTDTQIEAAVFHQLLHIGADEKGNWIFSPHDFEGFAQEVRHYGTWTSDLKLGGTAFVAAHQMGLFTDEDEDEDGEDDSIADGMELEDEERAAVQGRPFDEPADPDGPAPDDDDPLTDVPFA